LSYFFLYVFVSSFMYLLRSLFMSLVLSFLLSFFRSFVSSFVIYLVPSFFSCVCACFKFDLFHLSFLHPLVIVSPFLDLFLYVFPFFISLCRYLL